jgi:hypothetical protein
MWYNRPTYNTYTPYGHGYSSFEDPYARVVARERAAREREAAARRAELLSWQQMQNAARSPYNSYLSDDEDDGTGYSVPYSYNLRPSTCSPYMHEDLKRREILERQRQLELARQAELDRRHEAERVQELQERSSMPQRVSFVPSSFDQHGLIVRSAFSFSPHPLTLPTPPSLFLHHKDPILYRLQQGQQNFPNTHHHTHQSLHLLKQPRSRSTPR